MTRGMKNIMFQYSRYIFCVVLLYIFYDFRNYCIKIFGKYYFSGFSVSRGSTAIDNTYSVRAVQFDTALWLQRDMLVLAAAGYILIHRRLKFSKIANFFFIYGLCDSNI